MSAYRMAVYCSNCEILRAQINELLFPKTKLYPRQTSLKAICVKCTAPLWRKKNDINIKDPDDEIWCPGQSWFRWNCPKIEHMHRYCNMCKAVWFEKCTE